MFKILKCFLFKRIKTTFDVQNLIDHVVSNQNFRFWERLDDDNYEMYVWGHVDANKISIKLAFV